MSGNRENEGSNAMKTSGFWGHFEEIALETGVDSNKLDETGTRGREKPEQLVLSGTSTVTEQREETDQDVGNKRYNAIPARIICETGTRQREESDQGIGNEQYCAIPTHIDCGTVTKQREENEQDESSYSYAVIPMKVSA